MKIDLRNFKMYNGNVYIVLNPWKHPYVLHNLMEHWGRNTLSHLLNSKIFRVYQGENLRLDGPSLIAISLDRGISIFIRGSLRDKFFKGVFSRTLVDSSISGRLMGSHLKKICVTADCIDKHVLVELVRYFKPVVLKGGLESILNLFSDAGFQVRCDELSCRELRRLRYLEREYGIGLNLYSMPERLRVIEGGALDYLCIGGYSKDCGYIIVDGESTSTHFPHVFIDLDRCAFRLQIFI